MCIKLTTGICAGTRSVTSSKSMLISPWELSESPLTWPPNPWAIMPTIKRAQSLRTDLTFVFNWDRSESKQSHSSVDTFTPISFSAEARFADSSVAPSRLLGLHSTNPCIFSWIWLVGMINIGHLPSSKNLRTCSQLSPSGMLIISSQNGFGSAIYK